MKLSALLVLPGLLVSGCAKDKKTPVQPSPTPSIENVVNFPPEVRAEDESVNEFLLETITTCLEKDYEAFRLLWSARDEPMTEEEFKRGWQANPKVTVKAIQKMRSSEGEIVYGIRALVELDPNKVPEPQRDVVLLFVKEQGKWRLARPPRSLAKVMKGEESPSPSPEAEAPETTATSVPIATPAPTP